MCHALQHSGIILSKEVRAMNGQADEFCLVDPLSRPLDHGDIVHKDGPPETIDSIAFGERKGGRYRERAFVPPLHEYSSHPLTCIGKAQRTFVSPSVHQSLLTIKEYTRKAERFGAFRLFHTVAHVIALVLLCYTPSWHRSFDLPPEYPLHPNATA